MEGEGRRWSGLFDRLSDDGARRSGKLLGSFLALVAPVTIGAAIAHGLRGDRLEAIEIGLVVPWLGAALALLWRGHLQTATWLVAAPLSAACLVIGLGGSTDSTWITAIGIPMLLVGAILPLRHAILLAGLQLGGSVVVLAVVPAARSTDTLVNGLGAAVLISLLVVAVIRHRNLLEAERGAALRLREGQLAEARRMEAIGRIAGGIAHDFNNLLTVIIANVALLRRRGDGSLDEIDQAAERAAGLTRELLAYGQRQVLQPRPLDLRETVAGIEQILVRAAGDGVTVSVVGEPALAAVKADPSQLQRVLLNLVSNARDALPRGGAVRIRLFNVVLEAGAVNGLAAGPYVALSVSDTGEGMSPATVARAFDPFFTTKEIGKGTGLGLASVQGIVRQSHGEVVITSAPGKGTEVVVYLPRSDEPIAPRPAPRPLPVALTATVLVVDDEDLVRHAIKQTLESEGAKVVAARDAGEALERFLAARDEIEVVVSDLALPGRSGLELVAELRRLEPGLPALLVTGHAPDEAAVERALGPGVRCLAKPFAAEALVGEVATLVAQ